MEKKIRMKFEEDFSKKVWDYHYSNYYNFENGDVWEFWKNIEIKIKEENIISAKVRFKDNVFEISGDIDFNFKSNKNPCIWQERKYEYYSDIIDNDKTIKEKEKELVKELLSFCKARMYSPCNMSLMLRTGGINSLKGNLSQDIRSLDRFDVYTYILDNYFKTKKLECFNKEMHIIFSYAWKNSICNRKLLEKFLDEFESIYDYFEKMYRIKNTNESKKLINSLIESGKQPINTMKRVKEFLELAEKFWELKPVNCSICEYHKNCKIETRKYNR